MRQTVWVCAALALLVFSSDAFAQGRGGGGRGGGGAAPAQPAQGGPPPATTAPAAPHEVVVIGCLERAGNNYNLKDFRDNNSYQINAPADVVAPSDSLAWHAGHELEVHGMLESGAAGGALRLRATQIMYIANKCPAK
jgi:hypothetical protein